jgi:hypothetical protein
MRNNVPIGSQRQREERRRGDRERERETGKSRQHARLVVLLEGDVHPTARLLEFHLLQLHELSWRVAVADGEAIRCVALIQPVVKIQRNVLVVRDKCSHGTSTIETNRLTCTRVDIAN